MIPLARKLALTAAFAASVTSAQARTIKCVDDQGVTHYGSTLPAQCVGHATAELSGHGLVVKRTERAPTEQERKARQTEAEQQRLEAQKEAEQKRQDSVLLASYSDEREIDAARNRELLRAEAALASARAMQARAASEPDRRRSDALIESARREIDEIKARHDGYKSRFIELKKANAGQRLSKL